MIHVYRENIASKALEDPNAITIGDIIQIHRADGSELLLYVARNKEDDRCSGCLFYNKKEECPGYYMTFKRGYLGSHTIDKFKVGPYKLCCHKLSTVCGSNLVFKPIDKVLEEL